MLASFCLLSGCGNSLSNAVPLEPALALLPGTGRSGEEGKAITVWFPDLPPEVVSRARFLLVRFVTVSDADREVPIFVRRQEINDDGTITIYVDIDAPPGRYLLRVDLETDRGALVVATASFVVQ